MKAKKICPTLFTEDLQATIQFYCDELSFRVDVLWPEDEATFCILQNGEQFLSFYSDALAGESEAMMSGQLHIDTADVLSLHQRLQQNHEILWGPDVYHYGRREFSVADPNGYRLVFSEATDDPPTC